MRERIDQIIARDQLEALAEILDGANASEVQYAAHRFFQVRPSTESRIENAERLALRPEASVRHVACRLLSQTYSEDNKKSVGLLHQLAADEDSSVRDAAATVLGRLLRMDFALMVDHLRAWTTDASPNVHRAVAIAAGRAARAERPEWAEPLLKLIEPLLSHGDPLLRRNLGPSALGTSFLQHYPILAFEYLVKWSTSNDAQVLWNVAMAFSGPAAAPIAKKAVIVLRKLSLDERRFVWRAVAAAMWKLGRKRPEIVRPELLRWLDDERRIDVAREALKYL
jgi:hypothetical protein